MASSSLPYCYFLFSSFLLFIISSSSAEISFRPKALVVPVSKYASTLQYLTTINQRTPLVPLNVSSSYRPARCWSAQCSLAKASGCGECFATAGPGCNNNTCSLFPGNMVTSTSTSGAQDVFFVRSTDRSNPGRFVSAPKLLFSCGSSFFLEGRAGGAVSMAGPRSVSLHSSPAFSFYQEFVGSRFFG